MISKLRQMFLVHNKIHTPLNLFLREFPYAEIHVSFYERALMRIFFLQDRSQPIFLLFKLHGLVDILTVLTKVVFVRLGNLTIFYFFLRLEFS